jgi:quercetin dioxygenase-like cupin family protein
MTEQADDAVVFDETSAGLLAEAAYGPSPGAAVRDVLLGRLEQECTAFAGFAFHLAIDENWQPHPVRGIRMKVLAVNRHLHYAMLLLDVAPGGRYPAHHHAGDEDCYVLSGSMQTLGRRLGPGDFLHADAGTNTSELWTDEGARVLLIVASYEARV